MIQHKFNVKHTYNAIQYRDFKREKKKVNWKAQLKGKANAGLLWASKPNNIYANNREKKFL